MSEDWEAIAWRLSGKGDRIVGFCGHTHKTETTARECASHLNGKEDSGNIIWVVSQVHYHKAY